jgi:hypothetical protein
VKKSKIAQNSIPVPCSLPPTTIFNANLLTAFFMYLDHTLDSSLRLCASASDKKIWFIYPKIAVKKFGTNVHIFYLH